MESSSLYRLASDAISDFYWSYYSPWMALLFAALLWASVIIGYKRFNRANKENDKLVGDEGKYTIVAMPPHERLAFPDSCVGCGEPTAPDCHVTVSAGIGAGMAHELSVTPGTLIGHSVRWNLPSCADCATGDAGPQAEASGLADIFIYGVMIACLVIAIVGFILVIGASDWLQLVWLVPTAVLLFVAIVMPAIWLADLVSRQWSKFRDREPAGLKMSNPMPCVTFRIEKVEKMPDGMSGGALPWGPHIYRFTFEHKDYAERFCAMNGGIVVLADGAGERELRETFHGPPLGPEILEFSLSMMTAWAVTFVIIIVLASLLALFGAFRFGDLFSIAGLGIVALISGCLAFGFTLGPDESSKSRD